MLPAALDKTHWGGSRKFVCVTFVLPNSTVSRALSLALGRNLCYNSTHVPKCIFVETEQRRCLAAPWGAPDRRRFLTGTGNGVGFLYTRDVFFIVMQEFFPVICL